MPRLGKGARSPVLDPITYVIPSAFVKKQKNIDFLSMYDKIIKDIFRLT